MGEPADPKRGQGQLLETLQEGAGREQEGAQGREIPGLGPAVSEAALDVPLACCQRVDLYRPPPPGSQSQPGKHRQRNAKMSRVPWLCHSDVVW